MLSHHKISEANGGVSPGRHFNKGLSIFRVDLILSDVFKAFQSKLPISGVDIYLGVDGSFCLACTNLLEGPVDAVLDGKVGIIPDDALVAAHGRIIFIDRRSNHSNKFEI